MPGEATATLTNTARDNPLEGPGSDRVSLEASGHVSNDAGLSGSAGLAVIYQMRFDDGYSHSLLPRRLHFGLETGPFRANAGILVDSSSFQRFAGLEAVLGGPGLNLRLHGGRGLNEVWEAGHPDQKWDNWVYGADVTGVFLDHTCGWLDRVYGQLNFRQGWTPDGKKHSTTLSGSVIGSLFDESLRLFFRGRYMPEDSGFRFNGGANFAMDPVNIQLSYLQTNLPPFFDVHDLPRYNDKRGRLALLVRPADWLSLQAAGELGQHVAAANVGADLTYGGLHLIGRHALDDSITNAYGVMANLRSPTILGGKLSSELHGFALLEDGNFIGRDQGLRMDLGGRLVFTPTSWIVLSAKAGYAISPIVGPGFYAEFNVKTGGAFSIDKESPGAPSRKPVKVVLARRPRPFGPLMEEVFTAIKVEDETKIFPHDQHVNDVSCDNCHSHAQLIVLRAKEATCKDCHSDNDFLDKRLPYFQKLSSVKHAVPVPDTMTCETCHDVSALDAPTGGRGPIVGYPHRGETRKPTALVWDKHGSRQDATCKACHTDSSSVQYKNRTVPSCNTCHNDLRSPHNPNGWLSGGHVMEAQIDVESCTACHTSLSSCRSCHSENGVRSNDIHHGIGFVRFGEDNKMRHGKVAAPSGGAICGACHSPDDARPKAQCRSCHN